MRVLRAHRPMTNIHITAMDHVLQKLTHHLSLLQDQIHSIRHRGPVLTLHAAARGGGEHEALHWAIGSVFVDVLDAGGWGGEVVGGVVGAH